MSYVDSTDNSGGRVHQLRTALTAPSGYAYAALSVFAFGAAGLVHRASTKRNRLG
ncbi:hypothetical protein ABNG03_06375 [Halorubrum sp. RMP-47]|uniref:hypothetical protein n=1 Tax=Halorubrum miltondacostae TaxID=3076378 RepID=UPI0035277FFA